jgi:hypothetical protein
MTAGGEEARLVEAELRDLVSLLGCASQVTVTVREIAGLSDGFAIDVDPAVEGPSPMSVMTGEGTLLTLSLGKSGVIEFVDKDLARNRQQIIGTMRLAMEHGLTEEIRVGTLRVVSRFRVITPAGSESIAHASSWSQGRSL